LTAPVTWRALPDQSGGTLEKALQMAAHASTDTTQLYDQREDRVTLNKVVKINIRGEPAANVRFQGRGETYRRLQMVRVPIECHVFEYTAYD